MFLRNILLYYLFITTPVIFLILSHTYKWLNAVSFVVVLMIYSLIYHPLISGLRLIALSKIKPWMIWFCFVPGVTMIFFRHLYFPSKTIKNE